MSDVARFTARVLEIPHRDDDIHLEPDKLRRNFLGAFGMSLRRAILDRNGPPRDPTEFAQPILEILGRPGRAQESDDG